eukprot:SAG25_NODE_14_length_24446_cov_22.033678_5_plen_207_part_00
MTKLKKADAPPQFRGQDARIAARGWLAQEHSDAIRDPVQQAPAQANREALAPLKQRGHLCCLRYEAVEHEDRGEELAAAHDVHDFLVDGEDQALRCLVVTAARAACVDDNMVQKHGHRHHLHEDEPNVVKALDRVTVTDFQKVPVDSVVVAGGEQRCGGGSVPKQLVRHAGCVLIALLLAAAQCPSPQHGRSTRIGHGRAAAGWWW